MNIMLSPKTEQSLQIIPSAHPTREPQNMGTNSRNPYYYKNHKLHWKRLLQGESWHPTFTEQVVPKVN